MKKIVITGAAGQVAYSMIFMIATKALFGDEQISLALIDREETMSILEGVALELEDGAFKNITKVEIGSDLSLFKDANIIFLVGAMPRQKGMERKDLLLSNGPIFVAQGKAIDKYASRDARVLVVGNPCNTNCLICLSHAKSLSPMQFCAMTRLDQNRAYYQMASLFDADVSDVKNLIIWGNHSSTQVIDCYNATIKGEAVDPEKALSIIPKVRERGAAIIAKRGRSSGASSALAAIDNMKSWCSADGVTSAAVFAESNSYSIDPSIVFSFPVIAEGNIWKIVPDYNTEKIMEDMKRSEKELLEEREIVKDLIG